MILMSYCILFKEKLKKYHAIKKKRKEEKMDKMKLSESKKALFSILFVSVFASLMVQQGYAQPCASTFFSALVQLIPCRASVSPFSPIPPTEGCCAAVKALGQPCLCVLVNGPPISGVDRTMAMQLPEKCTANFEPCMAK